MPGIFDDPEYRRGQAQLTAVQTTMAWLCVLIFVAVTAYRCGAGTLGD